MTAVNLCAPKEFFTRDNCLASLTCIRERD